MDNKSFIQEEWEMIADLLYQMLDRHNLNMYKTSCDCDDCIAIKLYENKKSI